MRPGSAILPFLIVILWPSPLTAQTSTDIEARNYFGETALMRAAEHGDIATVQTLIKGGANVNAMDKFGNTPLLETSNAEVLRALIQAGADVNARDSSRGWTALMWSASNGRLEAVQALIEGGADINTADRHGRTALMQAAYLGYTEVVEDLIRAKANVNVASEDGTSALTLAAWGCHEAIVRELIRAGATVQSMKWNTRNPPKFEDFPAHSRYRGKPAPVDIHNSELARTYRTRLREGVRKGPNFAGHYTVVDWGCGSNCQVYAVVDTRTGKVFGTIGGERGADFKVDSSLFVADPQYPSDADAYPDDPVQTLPARYYVWRDNKFFQIYEQACSIVDRHVKCGCGQVEDLLGQSPSGR